MKIRSHALWLAGALCVAAFAAPASGAVFEVDPAPGDSNDGGAPYSLRDAILAANASPGADTIQLPAGNFTLSLGPVDPSGSGPATFAPDTGDLDVSEDLIILGAGPDQSFIDGALLDRVFDIHGVNVTILGVEIRNGYAAGTALPNEGGAVFLRAADSSGAPAGGAALTLQNCRFIQNSSDVNGGAVGVRSAAGLVKNQLAASGCAFEQNTAGYGGGAIALLGAGGTISNCEFVANAASGSPGTGFGGGAISSNAGSAGTLQLTGCVFQGNTANYGGAFSHHGGALDLAKSDFQMNVAVRHGGAVARSPVGVASSMTISESNFFGNSGGLSAAIPEDQGGAIWNFGGSEISLLQISLSRLYGNTGGAGEELFAAGVGAVTTAENNWWGHNAAPSSPGEIAFGGGAPPIDADPVLVLNFSAPLEAPAGGSVPIEANLRINSDGFEPGGGGNFVSNGVPVIWGGSGGISTGPPAFTSGIAEGLFTAGAVLGPAEASVTVDEEIADEPIEIVAPPIALFITDQPDSQTVDPGASASFSVAAEGDPPLGFQWLRNNDPMTGETSSTLTLASAQEPDEAIYYCRVSDANEERLSAGAQLTVNDPAVILASPPNQAVNCGATILFHAEAAGTAPLEYQWLKNNDEIPGATTATLTIVLAAEDDEAQYVCRVSNALATKFTDDAELLVFGCGADPREPNAAEFVSADLPQYMRANSGGFGFIRVRNLSNLSWSAFQGYNLALLQNDENMANWPDGFPRIVIHDPLLVIPGPGGEHVFPFSIHAPPVVGIYNIEFQMVEENVEFFGPTLARTIEVRNSVADWALYE